MAASKIVTAVRRLAGAASDEAWSLPAGGIDLGESPPEAIVREVLEETGYKVSVHGIVGVFGGRELRYTYPNGDPVEYVVTLFQCKIVGGTGRYTDAETKSIRYFERHEMPKLAWAYPIEELFGRFSQHQDLPTSVWKARSCGSAGLSK